jgi:hypothetical protein
MKWIMSVVLLASTSLGMVGCSDGTPGGPGVAGGETKDRAKTFALNTPSLDTTVDQGGTEQVKVSVNRGRQMDQQITLRFEGLPPGVTVNPDKAEIAPGTNDATVTVNAAPDAPVGKFTVTVVGEPVQGANAVAKMDIKVQQTNR